MTKNIDLSIIMPVYNEEQCIAMAVDEVKNAVASVVPNYELIIINDGSTDKTEVILNNLKSKEPQLKVIHKKNGGHGHSLYTGLDQAKGRYLLLVDSDRQIAFSNFGKIWMDIQHADVYFGQRVKRYDPKIRVLLTHAVRIIIHLFFGVYIFDANVPFKLIRKEIWQQAKKIIPENTLIPSLFLAIYCKRMGFKIIEEPSEHRKRDGGTSSIRNWKLFRFCTKSFLQLIVFRINLERMRRNV